MKVENELKSKLESVLSRHADDAFAIGDVLGEIRDSLKGQVGAFAEYCEKELPVGYVFAQQYIQISEDRNLRNYENIIKIPRSPRTLLSLCGLPEAEFQKAVASGAIHPKMKQKEAQAFRKTVVPTKPRTSKPKPAAEVARGKVFSLYDAQAEVIKAFSALCGVNSYADTQDGAVDLSLNPDSAKAEVLAVLKGVFEGPIANIYLDTKALEDDGTLVITARTNAKNMEGLNVTVRIGYDKPSQ